MLLRLQHLSLKCLVVPQRYLLVLIWDFWILNLCLKLMADLILFSAVGTSYQTDNIATITWQIMFNKICLMMMMNCFCGMVNRRKAFSLIPSRDHCQRSSPSQISDTPGVGSEPAQNLSFGLVEWSCAVAITISLTCYCTSKLTTCY